VLISAFAPRVDLSQVLFIATANSLETISEPLYDRMEPVELSGYIVESIPSTFVAPRLDTEAGSRCLQHDEKLHIARQKLLPKQLDANGLDSALVSLPDSTILHLIQHYTREAGVRSLERELGAVCRAKAVEYSRARDEVRATRDGGPDGAEIDLEAVISRGYRPGVSPEDLEQILGSSRHIDEELAQTGRVGVSTGLAYQGSGNGGILRESPRL
jgi:ATP-dependent Lon protease